MEGLGIRLPVLTIALRAQAALVRLSKSVAEESARRLSNAQLTERKEANIRLGPTGCKEVFVAITRTPIASLWILCRLHPLVSRETWN